MFKTVHLAAITLPLAAVLAWPGQAPWVVSIPVILTAAATLGVGALATLRECWTSVVGDNSQRLLLRLRWAVWMRQPADCSALAEALVDRAGLSFNPNTASERTVLVGLMYNLRRMNARHAGALGTPLTSHELARQLWAVAPETATERSAWLRLAEDAHAQAVDVEMPEGLIARLIRARNVVVGAVCWGASRGRLMERYAAFGGKAVAAIPLAEVTAFGLAGHRDPGAALLHAATTGALKENDVDSRTEGLGALPLAIQARLVGLLLLLDDAPLARLRAWCIASGALSQLLELRDIVRRAEALEPGAMDPSAFEGPAAADGLFDAMAGREHAAATLADAVTEDDATVADLAEAREARRAAPSLSGLLSAPRRLMTRVQSSLALALPQEEEEWEEWVEQQHAQDRAARAARPVAVVEPAPQAVAPVEAQRFQPLQPAEAPVEPVSRPAGPSVQTAARAAARALAAQAARLAPVAPVVAPAAVLARPAPAPVPQPEIEPRGEIKQALYMRRVWQPGQVLRIVGGQLGGVPSLPQGVAWPRHAERGEPLHFLAQIDCAAAHAEATLLEALPDLPRDGQLLIFADVGVHLSRVPMEVSVLHLSAEQVAVARPADLPADLPDIDHEARTAVTLSDRPGQRIFPRFAFDFCPIETEAGDGLPQDRTQSEIARHLPAPSAAPRPRLFQRVPEAERAQGGGFWRYEEAVLGTSFPATAALARSTFGAIAAQAARVRARCAAHARMADEAGLPEDKHMTKRMAWLDALVASADILRARLPEVGSAADQALPATERARMRMWLRVIAQRNPEAGPVAEAAIRDILQKQAIAAIHAPETAGDLGRAALAFAAPSLRPSPEDADHRLGGAACHGERPLPNMEKLLQLDSDPALGFRFADECGEAGKLEIWLPREGSFAERLAQATGMVIAS